MIRTLSHAFAFILYIGMVSCGQSQEAKALTQETAPKVSISKTLKENEHLPISERIALYLKLKKEKPDAYNFENEDELTMYGYGLLWNNQPEAATEIFKLIVSQFPNSSNPYDSLGEGYLALGNTELALENYQKSLALNPTNFNAEDQIERIKFPNKKILTPAEKFSTVYTIQEYKDDLDELGNKLLAVHPNALKFITKDAFWEAIEKQKQRLTSQTTYANFYWMCNQIIANVNCSHTSTGGFFEEWQMVPQDKVFPLHVNWINNKLYVIDNTGNTDKVRLGDEITTINGREVHPLVQEIATYIPSQGHIETYKKYTFNTWATAMIPYHLQFPSSYTITLKGTANPITLNPVPKAQLTFNEPFKKPCPENLCLEYPSENTAILTISSFNYYPWNNLEVFTQFIDTSFKDLEAKGVTNLIIDVRYNGGGSPESSIHLLKYLLPQPFTYFIDPEKPNNSQTYKPVANPFKGRLYFLMDGQGNSTTGHFMALAKEHKLGTLIGEELGSNQLCTAGQTICRLSHTKILYYVANAPSRVQVTAGDDSRGIFPDYEVIQPIEALLNNTDTVKEFALTLIHKNPK